MTKVKNFIIIGVLFIYTLFNTGIHQDEYFFINGIVPLSEVLYQAPLLYLFIIEPFNYISYKYIYIVDFLKILYIGVSIYLIFKFLTIFHSKYLSILLSFFIIFFIIHDSTIFWFSSLHYILSFGMITFSYYLLHNRKIFYSMLFGLLGAFISYSSPMYFTGLTILFLLNKEYKKFFIFIIPIICYISYYFLVTQYLEIGYNKIGMNNTYFLKSFLLQVITYFDAVLISNSIKTYYLFIEASFIDYIISLAIIIYINKYISFNEKINKKLMIAFFIMALSGFFVLSLTGIYNQVAFSLGNRVTFFTTMFIVYFLVTYKYSRIIKNIFIFIILVSIFSISSHWKEWNVYLLNITKNINSNLDVNNLNDETIFIYGKTKSKIGYIDHLGFNIKYNRNKVKEIVVLNKSLKIVNDKLMHKFNNLEYSINDGFIYVYFLETNKLKKVHKNDIQELIDNSFNHYRHWIQVLPDDNYIKDIISKILPQIKYQL